MTHIIASTKETASPAPAESNTPAASSDAGVPSGRLSAALSASRSPVSVCVEIGVGDVEMTDALNEITEVGMAGLLLKPARPFLCLFGD